VQAQSGAGFSEDVSQKQMLFVSYQPLVHAETEVSAETFHGAGALA